MKEYDIISQGGKIKNIREQFGLTQEEVAGAEITRNLISVIENDKANLTEHTANVIATNINEICEKRKIDYAVSKDYLLESITNQAKRVADEYIRFVKRIDIKKVNEIYEILDEIEVFLRKYDVEEKKARLYIEIGLKFREGNKYSTALNYFLKAYENSNDLRITTNSLIWLGSSCIYLSNYSEALSYFNVLLDLNEDKQVQYIARFNIALCHKKLSNYKESVRVLKTIIDMHSDILEESFRCKLDVYSLMGICSNELGSFNKATEIYKDLLKEINKNFSKTYSKDRAFILSNLADVYSKTKDYFNLDKICEKMVKILNTNTSLLNEYEADICLSLAENLKEINGDKDVIIQFLMCALNSFKTSTSSMCIDDVEKIFTNMLDIFIKENDEEQIDYLKVEVFEMVKKGNFPKCSLTLLRIIQYYNLKQKNDEVENMIQCIMS